MNNADHELKDWKDAELRAKTATIGEQRAQILDLRAEVDRLSVELENFKTNHMKLWLELDKLQKMTVWEFTKLKWRQNNG